MRKILWHVQSRFRPLLHVEASNLPLLEISNSDPDQRAKVEAVFKRLLGILPAKGITLSCILDGRSRCREKDSEALSTMLSFMADLCDLESGTGNLKFLVTSSTGFKSEESNHQVTSPLEVPKEVYARELIWDHIVDTDLRNDHSLYYS